MADFALNKVRWLSLREIAHLFAKDANLPEAIMLRELQHAVVNIPLLKQNLPMIAEPLKPDQLADPDAHLVDRDWLVDFCGKQGWTFPDFWGEKIEANPRFPGRPGYPHRIAIETELERRAVAAELSLTLVAQAKALTKWAGETYPLDKAPSALTVENTIRHRYRELKAAHKIK